MKLDNALISKFMKLSLLAGYFADKKKSNLIWEKELLVALLYLLSTSVEVRSTLLKYWFDIDRILNKLWEYYPLPANFEFDIENFNLSFSKEVYELFLWLEVVEKDYMLPVYLLFKLLWSDKILDFFEKIYLIDILKNFDMNWFLDEVYKNKKLQKHMTNIFFTKSKKNDMVIEIFVNSIKDSEFSDFDIEDQEDNVKEETTKTENTKLLLDTFWTNLTLLAKEWKLEPVVWREKELKEVIYTLLRKTKNNPLLVWEAGVGKTAIVEWLAQKIVKWEVPEKLKDKKIYVLDMWTLVAWTKYRWEFESRLKQIINEAINPENNIILFIDEIHTIVWAWNQEWGADTANLIKPYLARGELTLIWATTFNEYQKYIEKDAALTRRFQLIKISEPSEAEAIELLRWIKHRFEDFHWVNISKEAIEKAVRLSKRYILDKHLPDKAIDLIDEAAARKSTIKISKENQKKIKTLENKIKNLEKKIGKLIDEQNYFEAAELKEEIKKIKDQIYKLRTENNIPKEKRPTVDSQDVEKVIAEKYEISSKVLSKSEIEFLSDMEEILNKEIIWQKEAVKEIVSAIIRNKLSPLERNKPIGAFLFLWPSWVWKTYLATLLSKHFFQDENALIKINMSEYSENVSSSKLIWASAWYVGYEEWGILTEAVRKKPYSVVLFDEVEKWSPQVLNILLQILDQWYLEDNKWRKVDFKNTIVILTSNLWSEYFNKDVVKVGFDTSQEDNLLTEEKKEIILNEVKNLFPVELLNRLDKIVFFNPINVETLEKVFEKYYNNYKKLWKDKKWVKIPALKKQEIKDIVEKIYKEGSGVRWVEKYIYNELENKVIEKILKDKKSKRV